MTNVEKLTFWIGDSKILQYAKEELLHQIDNLDISIHGNGFFKVDRKFLASVSSIVDNEEYFAEIH